MDKDEIFQRIAGILQAPGGQVARVLSAYAKKDEAQAA